MPDVLKLLPHFSFRGIIVPISGGREASFAHEGVRHKFTYRDGEFVEHTGAQNWTFSYTIPMRQGIAVGPYRDLYTVALPQFLAAVRDRSPGELNDPELGIFRVVPTQATSSIDVNRRDGTDLRVEFVEAPEFDDVEFAVYGTLDASSAESEAGALDEQISLVDWEQEVPPEPLFDPFTALDSIGSQLEFAANKFSNAIDDAAFRAEKLESTIDRLQNPQAWPLKRSARRFRGSMHRLKEQSEPSRIVRNVTNNYQRTLFAVAADFGMTVQDLLKLNPELAALPMVPAGVTVRRYA